MKLLIELNEQETKKDITSLTVANAIIDLVENHNNNNSQVFEDYIFINDIAKALQIMVESEERFYNNLKDIYAEP